MKTTNQSDIQPAVISAGLFFLITGDTATAHLIPQDCVTRFYDGARIADNCRDPESALQQVIRDTFRVKECRAALPAPSYEALVFYLDHYAGPAQAAVQRLAAEYLAGVPFVRRDSNDGGAHDRVPVQPKIPGGPHDALQPQNIGAQLMRVS